MHVGEPTGDEYYHGEFAGEFDGQPAITSGEFADELDGSFHHMQDTECFEQNVEVAPDMGTMSSWC